MADFIKDDKLIDRKTGKPFPVKGTVTGRFPSSKEDGPNEANKPQSKKETYYEG